MWVMWLLGLFLFAASALGESGFDEKYERDYNIFNPINQLRPDNPLNPINAVDPTNPFNPINSVDPGNPANPINRYNRNNPFNPINEVNPNNPLNPINRYNPNTPFGPLNTFPDRHASLFASIRTGGTQAESVILTTILGGRQSCSTDSRPVRDGQGQRCRAAHPRL